MTQLSLFPLDWREVVPLDPQPHLAERFTCWPAVAGVDWIWEYRPGINRICTYPAYAKGYGFYEHCPLRKGTFFRGGVIEDITLQHISTGWVWIVRLREILDTDDFGVFHSMLQPEPRLTLWQEEIEETDT